VFHAIKPFLSEVEGVFLFGSFARNEQAEDSDIDILVITGKKMALKGKGRFDFLVKTREEFEKELKIDPTLFLRQILAEAKPVFNESLLDELRLVKAEPDFGEFLDSTLNAFKSTMLLLEAEKKAGKGHLDSGACIYSLVLRLRTMLLIRLFLKKQSFSSKKFRKLLKAHGFSESAVSDFLAVYRAERDGREFTQKISLSEAEKLFEAAKIEFLKTEGLLQK